MEAIEDKRTRGRGGPGGGVNQMGKVDQVEGWTRGRGEPAFAGTSALTSEEDGGRWERPLIYLLITDEEEEE